MSTIIDVEKPLGGEDLTVLRTVHVPEVGDVNLIAASAQRFPRLYSAYQRGQAHRCNEIGTPEFAAPAAVPCVPTTLVLAARGAAIAGGICVRNTVEFPDAAGFEGFGERLADRRPEGLGELRGLWIGSRWLRRGLATHVLQAGVDVSARSGRRWLVAIANHVSLPALVRLGFEVDQAFTGIPFPTEHFRSTVTWYDHHR